jgi:hypothetical protein
MARPHTFRIQLWDQSVQAIDRTDDCLPAEIRAELPLEKVWTLVREGAQDET